MKKIIIGIMSLFAMYVNAFASPASLSAKAVIKGGEELAAKLGLRTASEAALRGGAKLAVVTTEREAAKHTAGGNRRRGVHEGDGKTSAGCRCRYGGGRCGA